MLEKNRERARHLKIALNYLIVTLGCLILAFADAVFIVPLNLVTGGVSSIAVIAQYLFELGGGTMDITDIVTWVVQILMLAISFFFLGKRYTLKTLYASILFPLLYSLFLRFQVGSFITEQLSAPTVVGDTSFENLSLTLLAGLFGGALVGASVAINYIGNGSTGGLDVLCSILAKHTPIKEGVGSFIFDALLIVVGMLFMRDIPHGFIGILSALACALVIQVGYVNMNSYVIADIISSETDKIMQYIHQKMDHATTVIDATGGYSGEGRKIVRVAFNRRELNDLKLFIAQVDPRAFVTFTNASMINGEGFDPLPKKSVEQNGEDHEKNGEQGL